VNRRTAKALAHEYAATWILQAIASAVEGLADSETDSDLIAEELREIEAQLSQQAERLRRVHLSAAQIELLGDIANHEQFYVKTFSRWAKTGAILVENGLATMSYCGGPGDQEIKITEAGVAEAKRRGLIAAKPAAGNSDG
jgi:hypothetical protein